jgi:hypothetical protein
MPLIRDKEKARRFIDQIDAPLTVRQTRGPDGGLEQEIILEPTDDLVGIVKAAEEQGFTLSYDGQRITVEDLPKGGLPAQTTPDPFLEGGESSE